MKYKSLLHILLSLLITTMVNAQDIQWEQKPNLPNAYRNGNAAASGGKVYFMGGYSDSTPERFEKANLEYDPEAETWTPKANMPTGRSNFALVTVAGKIYAIGGDPFSPSNEVYDPATDSWTNLEPMITPRQHVNGGVAHGKIYVIGGLMAVAEEDDQSPSGWDYRNISDINEAYDPVANTWEKRAPMPTPRHGAYIASVGGKLYVIGGMGDEQDMWKALPVVEMYDPMTDSWHTRSGLPEPRDGFGVSVIDGKIYVIGGFSGSQVVNSVYVYDPVSDSWSTSTEFPNTENGSSGCATIGRKVFVLGGCNADYVANPNVFEGKVRTSDRD